MVIYIKKNIFLPKFIKSNSSSHYIRSFVCRQRKLTKRQQYMLDNYWPIIGIEFNEQLLDFSVLFNSTAPIILEIGFGTGALLVAMAKKFPKLNFLGIEVYLPGVSACLASVHEYEEEINNLRIIHHDAVEVLEKMIPDNSLNTIQLFFPDPWRKTRHNKRRIIQIQFAKLIKKKLKLGGILHIMTDWEPYVQHILKIISSLEGYRKQSEDDNCILHAMSSRPITKFEYRSYLFGNHVWDLIFKKIK